GPAPVPTGENGDSSGKGGPPGETAGGDGSGRADDRPGSGAGRFGLTPPRPTTAAAGDASAGPRPGVGSNNWAVSGRLTRSGHPILCNDMHLELSLPAVWYEVQLTAPGINVRGVSFPAAPLVVAGYNEDIAWGFTNATSDVLDWYAITFKDGTHAEYLYDGEWREATVREERIEVRGGETVIDRVVSTHHGPVVRWEGEPAFPGMDVPAGAALRWLAHDPSNEFATLYALDKAGGYGDFVEALEAWICPGQNFVYADREGTIAIWHNGRFPLRRPGQGRLVLDGSDPSEEWRGWVPRGEVPHARDPERGFVSSANQAAVDAGYPYYLGWDYASFERAARINEILRGARDITAEDMVRMQTDVLDVRARAVLPRLLAWLGDAEMNGTAGKCLEELRDWDFEARADAVDPTVFRELWGELNRLAWDDETSGDMGRMPRPASQVVIGLVLDEPGSPWFDDRTTPEVEAAPDIAVRAFRSAIVNLETKLGPYGDSWRWGRAKGTEIRHLARVPGFSRDIEANGAGHVINAIDAVWGPSWRMVVEFGPRVRAWGNYPGGQSGHPGSRFYDDRVDDWAAGRPCELVFLGSAEEPHPRVVGRTVMRGGR
ncbi:MAG: penicillin acylase family protein, partial [Candidatus Aminicenantes bacterium]|nr:penicillin acylase family protein [Candidatus Aminicenantes bacterium]